MDISINNSIPTFGAKIVRAPKTRLKDLCYEVNKLQEQGIRECKIAEKLGISETSVKAIKESNKHINIHNSALKDIRNSLFKECVALKVNTDVLMKIFKRPKMWVAEMLGKENLTINKYEKACSIKNYTKSKDLEYALKIQPLINEYFTTEQMSKITGLEKSEIDNWILKKYKKNPIYLLKYMQDAKKQFEMNDMLQNGTDKKVIIDKLNTNNTWIKNHTFKQTLNIRNKNDIKELIPFLLDHGFDTKQISKVIGICRAAVYNWIERSYQTPYKSVKQQIKFTRNDKLYFKELLEDLFVNQNKSLGEVAKYLGKSKSTILRSIKIFNIKTPEQRTREKMGRELLWLHKQGKTTQELADYFNVDSTTINRNLRRLEKLKQTQNK